jgi:ketose-bisphosphate aldolase
MGQIIMHIDVNSAFLSWTAAYEKQMGIERDVRTLPAVIGGNEQSRHGIVLAKSVPAKKFKIQTGMSLMEARRLCPNLLVIPPSYDIYVRASKALREYLKKYTPDVEVFSIDECFLRFTDISREEALDLAYKLKEGVKERFGYTVNVGISENKLLAKQAGDLEKPDKCHTMFIEENIALTKKVVEYAHSKGVVVEAELGKLAGVEDAIKVKSKDATYTDPDEAVEFVERTGVDSLAIAIGTSHGAYKFKGEPTLDFERLETITRLLPGFPLVLHGASSVPAEFVQLCNKYGGQIPGAAGVPEEMLRRAAQLGVCKINIDTDLRLALTACIRQFFVEHPSEFDPRKYLGPGRTAIKDMVAHKMRNVLGCSNKR